MGSRLKPELHTPPPTQGACNLQIVPGVFPTGVITPMKHAAAKVGGNQDRMAGQRLTVDFVQIVPGVFPTGVVTPMKHAAAKVSH